MCRSLIAPTVACGSVFVPRIAAARTLDYRAPEGCPSQLEVARRVDARAPEGRDVQLDVRAEKDGYVGQVSIGDGEHRLVRSIGARTCDAVVEALVLVVALDREEAEHSTEEPPSKPPPTPTHREDSPWPTPRTPPDVETTSSALPSRSGVTGGVGVDVVVTDFANGKPLSGLAPFLEIASSAGFVGWRWLGISARASLLWSTSSSFAERNGVQSDFSFLGGALDGCLGSRWGKGFDAAVCSRTEAGSLTASASGAAGAAGSSRARPWLASGAVGRIQVRFSTSPYVPHVEVAAGVLAVLIRDRFHFSGHDPIVASPALWTIGAGLGWEIR